MPFRSVAMLGALGLISASLSAAEPSVPVPGIPAAVLLPAAAVNASAVAATAQPAAGAAPAVPVETPFQKHRRLREELRRKLGPSVHLLN